MSRENLSEGISVQGVSKSFGSIIALDDVNLEVTKGTVTALLGPNGAGKTTLIRILTTLLFPDSGTAIVSGYDAVRDATRLRSIIGLAGQNAAVDENLTGRENLELVGRLYHVSKSEAKARTNRLLTKFELTEFADRRVKTYSGGMRRRLDLAASLVGNPKILFLDEPTAGLDPRSRLALWSVIKELVEEGVTMLLTTQYLEEADHLADRMVILDHGKVIAEGTSDELKSRVGGGVLELRLGEPRELQTALNAISGLTNGGVQSDGESGVITIPVVDGTSILVSAIRRLDEVGIKVSGIELRKPTLDEAFLSLTGQGRGTDALKEVV
ncbi:MAG: ATP-binding cassette domain-containing protein [Thaumarchaeota archaeon]|nr:ATP-binding cassette domain-containing protein [Nitrososphaerota archaeon]